MVPRIERDGPRKANSEGVQTSLEKLWFSHRIAERVAGVARLELVWNRWAHNGQPSGVGVGGRQWTAGDVGMHWESGCQWGRKPAKLMGCVEGGWACRGSGQSAWAPSHRRGVPWLPRALVSLSRKLQLHPLQPEALRLQRDRIRGLWWAGSVGYPRINYVVVLCFTLQIHTSS